MTPKFDKLLSEIAGLNTPGIDYARKKASDYNNMTVGQKLKDRVPRIGGQSHRFVDAIKGVDDKMLQLAKKERHAIEMMARTGEKSYKNAMKVINKYQKDAAKTPPVLDSK